MFFISSSAIMTDIAADFRRDYARHRAEEGRALRGDALRSLPYLRGGLLARQWRVRVRSFEALMAHVIAPREDRVLDILDLGAGNGWLCHRLALRGHRAAALDMRDDPVDGLGAAAEFLAERPGLFECVTASFEALPFTQPCFDVAIFNASLHYAKDLAQALAEAARVTRQGGVLVILDSPFYRRESDGLRMVAEKHAQGAARFGARAAVLMGQDFIEFLTRERLAAAAPALAWSRRRVLYPLWYEMRPLQAMLQGRRPPSRFDLWTAAVP
jgi:SAM-dependent methyltransferase